MRCIQWTCQRSSPPLAAAPPSYLPRRPQNHSNGCRLHHVVLLLCIIGGAVGLLARPASLRVVSHKTLPYVVASNG
jgi:hypothetical protein